MRAMFITYLVLVAAGLAYFVTIGLLQFVTPVMQLLCGVLLLGEHMSPQRWAGFALVWVALAILTVDSAVSAHRRRAGGRGSGAAGRAGDERRNEASGVCEPTP